MCVGGCLACVDLPAKVRMVVDSWPQDWKISVHWVFILMSDYKERKPNTPKLRRISEVFLWLFCL